MHVETFLFLFGVATAVAVAARLLKLPYTVALVLTGLGLGATRAFAAPALTHELLFSGILPGLIFEAAFHLDARSFWRDRLAINAMATPGLVLAMLLTAAMLVPTVGALHLAAGFTFIHGVVFAAIIGATDPIAVVALFRSLGAPRRLAVIIEGESLLNDGTGVVIFGLALTAATGGRITAAQAALEFLRIAGLGALIGLAAGQLVGRAIRRLHDPMVEITLTVILAYGSFVLAEKLGGSGVISTVAAGMTAGQLLAHDRPQKAASSGLEPFWEYAAFALNSIVFLLLGFEVRLAPLLEAWQPILAAYLAATLARGAVVAGVVGLLRSTSHVVPWSWAAVIGWSGLRGALSVVLVLGLPDDFPQRALMVDMTFGVVLLTLLVQGVTMGPLLTRLGLVNADAPVVSA